MNKDELHKELRSFPKNKKLSEEHIKAFSKKIDEEITNPSLEPMIYKSYFKKTVAIISSVAALILFSFILFVSQNGGEEEINRNATSNETIEIGDFEKEIMENYLSENAIKPNFGGKMFSAFEILGSNKEKNEVYVWGLIEEYNLRNSSKSESGISAPFVLRVAHESSHFRIVDHSIPGDGSQYVEDIKDMFPAKVQNKILTFPSQHIQDLQKEMERKVKEWITDNLDEPTETAHDYQMLTINKGDGSMTIDLSKIPEVIKYLEGNGIPEIEYGRMQGEYITSQNGYDYAMIQFSCGTKLCSQLLLKAKEDEYQTLFLSEISIYQEFLMDGELAAFRFRRTEGAEVARDHVVVVNLHTLTKKEPINLEELPLPFTLPILDMDWVNHNELLLVYPELSDYTYEQISDWFKTNDLPKKTITMQF